MRNFRNKYLALVFIAPLMLWRCNKDTFTPVQVTYLVLAKPGNTVTISCNNDFYFDTGTRKPIVHTSEGLYFRSTHIARKEEDYYLQVSYTDSTVATEDNFLVWIKFNDSTIVKQLYPYAKPNVEFTGRVTEL